MTIEFSEIYLSAVIGRSVINSAGDKIGTLRDLIMVPGQVFPEVSHIVIKARKGLKSLPWNEVALFTHVLVSSIGINSPGLCHYESREGEILVKRDLLDKQIVDMDGAKVVRVNDIKLGRLLDKLCIFSVDIGFRGLLRRLGYERFGEKIAKVLEKEIPNAEISWQYVQPLEANSSKLALTIARDQMNEIHPADLADILEDIPIQHIKTVLESLDEETTGDTLYELEADRRNVVISQLNPEQMSDILEEMELDEVADILEEMPEEKAQELLDMMDEEDAEDIQELLEQEDNTAGGIMNTGYFRLSSEMTVSIALEQVRLHADDVETVYYGFVVDKEERMEGVVSLRELLIHPPDLLLPEIMETNVKYVHVDTDLEETVEILTKYNLIVVPVLDKEELLAGIVNVDDVLAHYLPRILKHRRG